jgi:hypothetical protein
MTRQARRPDGRTDGQYYTSERVTSSLTMLSRPAAVCLSWKFSSSNCAP